MSQQPVTFPCPEPHESGPHPSLLISIRIVLILSSILRLGLHSVSFPTSFPANILYAFILSPPSVTGTAHHILFDLIALIIFDAAPYCAVSFSLLLIAYYLAPVAFSAPCFLTPLAYGFPLMWETDFYTNTKQEARLYLRYIIVEF